MITLHKISIIFDPLLAVIAVWFTDLFVGYIATLTIVSPMLREILLDCKDIISILVSVLIGIFTIFRIKNEIKKTK